MPWVAECKVEYADETEKRAEVVISCIRASLALAHAAHRRMLDHPDMLEQPPEAYQDWLSMLVFRACPALEVDLRPRALEGMELWELEDTWVRLVTGED